jgi:hypothetical protein
MPRPGYVMFALSGADDRVSNLVSLFDIVEVINVFQPDPAIQFNQIASKPNRIVVTWLREDVDTDTDRFEGQIACVGPDGIDLFAYNAETFSFHPAAPFYRWTAPIMPFGFNVLGVHQIEARLRRVGEQEWLYRQSFPFVVQAMQQPQLIAQPIGDPAQLPTTNPQLQPAQN